MQAVAAVAPGGGGSLQHGAVVGLQHHGGMQHHTNMMTSATGASSGQVTTSEYLA